MSGARYPEEFKIEAVKQVTENGYSVSEVAKRLGVTTKSLYDWKARYGKSTEQISQDAALKAELRQLRKENKRLQMERDILKEATRFFAGESKKDTRS
jgi:transposase